MPDELIVRLGLALVVGLVVGLERGWREREAPPGSRTAGIRTYGISGLLGGIFFALSEALGGVAVFCAGFVGFAAVFAWFQYREVVRDESYSVTSVVVALTVFGLGGLAASGNYRAAAAGGVALAGILASREVLHGLLRRLTWVELRSALLLAGMTVIVLPLLPDAAIDPWDGINPRQIWIFTVLTAAISYGGYIAVRIFGPGKGTLISGLAGALVSSTAVTLAFARRASAGEPVRPLAGGAVLAAMVSVLRVLVIVGLVKPELALAIAPPALAAGLVFGLVGAALLLRNAGMSAAEFEPGNPFDLGPLLLFAGMFAVVSAASAVLTRTLGSASVIATSAVSGFLDVDVAALTAARLAGVSVPIATAAIAVLLAIALNAVARIGVAFAAGPLRYALPLTGATAAAFAAGFAALLLFVLQ